MLMEPFYLRSHQVNFEDYEYPTFDDQLDPFNTVVSFGFDKFSDSAVGVPGSLNTNAQEGSLQSSFLGLSPRRLASSSLASNTAQESRVEHASSFDSFTNASDNLALKNSFIGTASLHQEHSGELKRASSNTEDVLASSNGMIQSIPSSTGPTNNLNPVNGSAVKESRCSSNQLISQCDGSPAFASTPKTSKYMGRLQDAIPPDMDNVVREQIHIPPDSIIRKLGGKFSTNSTRATLISHADTVNYRTMLKSTNSHTPLHKPAACEQSVSCTDAHSHGKKQISEHLQEVDMYDTPSPVSCLSNRPLPSEEQLQQRVVPPRSPMASSAEEKQVMQSEVYSDQALSSSASEAKPVLHQSVVQCLLGSGVPSTQTANADLKKPTNDYQQEVYNSRNDPTLLMGIRPQDWLVGEGSASQSLTIDEGLKERLHLEGQLEVLTEEAEQRAEERARLKAELVSLKAVLQNTVQSASHQQRLSPMVDGSKERESRLEAEVVRLSETLDTFKEGMRRKEAALRSSEEAVRHAQELTEHVRESAREVHENALGKESEMGMLRAKVSALEVEVREVAAVRVAAEGQAKDKEEETRSIAAAKKWYQQQLHSAQRARSDLQAELTRLQNQTSWQTDSIERLRVECASAQHALAASQQRALSEKQTLARHLETLEADMEEREAGFSNLEKDQGLTEANYQHQMLQIEKEKMRVSKLMARCAELERYTEERRHEVDAKTAEAAVLEAQQEDLKRTLVSAQSSLQDKDQSLEQLLEQLAQSQTEAEHIRMREKEKNYQLDALRSEKATMEDTLRSSHEEKCALTNAIEGLREKTARVEKTYKSMKNDLAAKSAEMIEMAREHGLLEDKLIAMERDNSMVTPKLENTLLAQDSAPLSADLQSYMERKVTVSVDGLLAEKERLLGDVALLTHQLTSAQTNVETMALDRAAVEQQFVHLRSQYAQLEQYVQRCAGEKEGQQRRLEAAHATLEELREDYKVALAKADKASGLVAQAEAMRRVMEERETSVNDERREYEDMLTLLNQQLREAVQSRDRAFKELSDIQDKTPSSGIMQKQEETFQLLERTRFELEESRAKKSIVDRHLSQLQTASRDLLEECKGLRGRVGRLEEALKEAHTYGETQRKAVQAGRQLAGDLERDRGRVAGIKQQNTKLKTRATLLEDALANKESALAEMSSAHMAALKRQGEQMTEVTSQVKQLESNLRVADSSNRDLKAQMVRKEEVVVRSKQAAQVSLVDYESAQQKLDAVALDLAAANDQLNQLKTVEKKQAVSLQELTESHQRAIQELSRLRMEAAETQAMNPIIQEETKDLRWQLRQKTKEADDHQNHLKRTEERLNIENDSIKKALTATKTESESLRLELGSNRKEKFSYQTRVTELRGAVETLLKNAKIKQVEEPGGKPSFDFSHFDRLLKDTAMPSYKTKPLASLKSLLTNLNSEMAALDEQLAENANVVQNSTDSWKAMEAEVKDLQKLVQAAKASRLTTGNPTESTVSGSSLSYAKTV